MKPNGLLGTAYMAAIATFRHLIVYPPMLRQIGRDWRAGAGTAPVELPLATLATLPRRELSDNSHCVAGWSATNLHSEGVAFETFDRAILEPSVQPAKSVTDVVFGGLDGFPLDRVARRRHVVGKVDVSPNSLDRGMSRIRWVSRLKEQLKT